MYKIITQNLHNFLEKGGENASWPIDGLQSFSGHKNFFKFRCPDSLPAVRIHIFETPSIYFATHFHYQFNSYNPSILEP